MHVQNELLMYMLMACVSWYTHMGGDSMRDCPLPDVGQLPSTPSLRLLSGCNPTDQCLNTTDRFCLIVPAAWTLMTLLSIEISVCGVEQIKQLHQTDFQKMCTNLKWAIAGDQFLMDLEGFGILKSVRAPGQMAPGLCLRSEGGRVATSARMNTRVEHHADGYLDECYH